MKLKKLLVSSLLLFIIVFNISTVDVQAKNDQNQVVVKSEIGKVLEAKEKQKSRSEQNAIEAALTMTVLFFVIVFYAAAKEKKFENQD